MMSHDENKPKEFALIETASWDALLASPDVDGNARDSEGNTLLVAAVRGQAPLHVVQRLIDGGANLLAANRKRETPLFYARGPILTYFLPKLKEQFPRVVNSLVGDDKNAQRDALATLYSVSLAEPRKVVELPDELWPKAVHLLRVDPSNVTTAQPKEVLCPLLIALANLSLEDKYATVVGAQPGSFAFLFGLACKHPSEAVQKYAIHALFSLSRLDKNKETITSKWFLVLAKLFGSTNTAIQTLATAIMAEISIGYDEAKAKIVKEVGLAKLAPLLRPTASEQQRFEAARVVTNITNRQPDVQKAVVREGLLAALLAVVVSPTRDNARRTQTAALSAVANVLSLLGDKEAVEAAADIGRENVTGALIGLLRDAREVDADTDALQEQNLRALVGVSKHKALSAEFIEKEGVEALLPLLGAGRNKELQKQAVRIIKNLSKKYKKRLGAKEPLLNGLQAVMLAESSANVQKVAKKTLSRLQASSK